MKPVLMLAALAVCLATPALAEDASTTTPPQQPQAQAAAQPVTQLVLPTALPHSTPPGQQPAMSLSGSDVPMPRGPAGGGCHHDAEQVYLTN